MKPAWHGPSHYGYTPEQREWWAICIRAYYRFVREDLRLARDWFIRLAEMKGKRRIRQTLETILFFLHAATQWREQARFMRREMKRRWP